MIRQNKILVFTVSGIALIILFFVVLDFSITKYKEATWREKIRLGLSEKEVYEILPVKSGVAIWAHGSHKGGLFELTDGTKINLSFHIPQKVLLKRLQEPAGKYDTIDTRNTNFKYVLESYKKIEKGNASQ